MEVSVVKGKVTQGMTTSYQSDKLYPKKTPKELIDELEVMYKEQQGTKGKKKKKKKDKLDRLIKAKIKKKKVLRPSNTTVNIREHKPAEYESVYFEDEWEETKKSLFFK